VQEVRIDECVVYTPGDLRAGGDQPVIGCPCGAVLPADCSQTLAIHAPREEIALTMQTPLREPRTIACI